MSVLDRFSTSFAQNREDIILSTFLVDIENGFYVDVGAADPVVDSPTKYFYDRGWRGINIEPNKFLHAKLSRDRDRDINLNIALGIKSEVLKLRLFGGTNHGLSTLSQEIMDEYENKDEAPDVFTDVEVEVRRAESVFKEFAKGREIHFMKIDVEGFEGNVLRGNNWSTFRPWIVCIEANHIVEEWQHYLLEQDYELVFWDGLNEYYLDKKHNDLKEKFNKRYADHVLLNQPFVDLRASREIASLEAQVLQLLERDSQLHGIRTVLNQYLGEKSVQDPYELEGVLADLTDEARWHAPGVIGSSKLLSKAIIRYIDRKVAALKRRSHTPISETYSFVTETNPQTLLYLAKDHDYSHYKQTEIHWPWLTVYKMAQVFQYLILVLMKITKFLLKKIKKLIKGGI